jgi:preprotein translocase subunit SecG
MKYLSLIQAITAVLLIIVILLQQRGSGLSTVFGGEGGFYRTKRGIEKFLFLASIILAFIFFGLGLVMVIW